MIFERLRLMRDLLADDGSIYLHCDGRVNGPLRLVLDEVFGREYFRNDIVWQRTSSHNDPNKYGNVHDTILYYSKSERVIWNQQYDPADLDFFDAHDFEKDVDGRHFRKRDLTAPAHGRGVGQFAWKGKLPPKGRMWSYTEENMQQLEAEGRIAYTKTGTPRMIIYVEDLKGLPAQSLWVQTNLRLNSAAKERLGYPTQKPEAILERVVESSSNTGDLIADFFCGSGTTLTVAEKLGRKWIGCDLGRFAVHTSRKRLIVVQREARKESRPYRSFEILNLGKYERMYFVGIDPNLAEPARREQSVRREEHYLHLILSAYKAERAFQAPPFHGKKGRTWVVVGPIDAPVTQSQFLGVVAECRQRKISSVDILGFEFEMGLHPNLTDEAKMQGVNVALRYIPKDVFDKRAVDAGQVQFPDLAYVEVKTQVQGLTAWVTLADFSVYYRQEDVDALGARLKPGGSKVTVANGQVLKLAKDKKGIVATEVLTKVWTDWVDYWAVDFDYESTPELLTEVVDGMEIRRTTGNFIFENEWQSFRTRKDRTLELTSAGHTYPKKGRYRIAVKVIDIFGNDTTKVVGVTI